MSSIVSAPVRPKIHRLPPPSARSYAPKKLPAPSLASVVISLTALMVVFAQVVEFSKKNHGGAIMLPAISVDSSDASDSQPLLISNAQAATLPKKPSAIIALRGKSDYIIGQMTKIPLENEQITEIKPVNNIDNHAGRELLSIISKY